MKYFKKFLILGLFALFGVSFCNADITLTIDHNLESRTYNQYNPEFQIGYSLFNNVKSSNSISGEINLINYDIYKDGVLQSINDLNLCLVPYDSNQNGKFIDSAGTRKDITSLGTTTFVLRNNNTNIYSVGYKLYFCTAGTYTGNIKYTITLKGISESDLFGYTQNNNQSSCDTGSILSGYILPENCPSCPTCPDQYTSLQCQTEYNLIPIEDVTKNYCEVNFDLIDPLDCPSSPSGSGDVSRSALYIDNVQYSGAPNIYININDLLEYSMTYVSGSAVVDVNGYSYDTGYMSDILTIQEYHPTSEDFTTSFVSFLTFALPYVVVILFVVFVRKLIRKIFKF